MIIGVDFDNTIVNYDDVIYRIAVQQGLITPNSLKSKKHIRDAIRRLPNGDQEWQKLQTIVYGTRMDEARIIDNVAVFFKLCLRYGVRVYIISHKTEYSNLAGSNINLRVAALSWMEKNNFFDAQGLNLKREDVFFEPTRTAKIDRIKSLKCDCFIDDLEETFLEPSFPTQIDKILYATHGQTASVTDAIVIDNWGEIISLMQKRLVNEAQLTNIFSDLLGQRVTSADNIDYGKNSKVYKLVCENRHQYIAKFYFSHYLDSRNRLATEFSGLQFLCANGIKSIPRPILADHSLSCGIYEYVEGQKLSTNDISSEEIDYAIAFLTGLKSLKDKSGSECLGNASEACFSFKAIVANLKMRLNRLKEMQKADTPNQALKEFIDDRLVPLLLEIESWVRISVDQADLDFNMDLPNEEKTLSPSDFGFHNAIKRKNGQIVFIDFEYFGWDDPAKMIVDFLLHPAMDLSEELKQYFVRNMFQQFPENKKLAKRVELVYPLFGLKWCLILLNEFLPEHMLRRRFAMKDKINQKGVLARQLAKSRKMLHRIEREYKSFPYGVCKIGQSLRK